jgi:hypothetical protein
LIKLETDHKKKQKLEQLKRHIEDSMRQEDQERMQDQEVLKKQAKKSKDRQDDISKMEEFGEFLTEKSDSDDDDSKSKKS